MLVARERCCLKREKSRRPRLSKYEGERNLWEGLFIISTPATAIRKEKEEGRKV